MAPNRIKVVAGYGASLRRQLQSVDMSQETLAELARVSRQTIARAINRDEVSDRTAEQISAALSLAPNGSASVAQPKSVGIRPTGAEPQELAVPDIKPLGRRSRQARARAMSRSRSDAWAGATDLVAWADRRDSQDALPELVRKLVLATVPQATRVEFRAGEGVQLSGWDGVVATPQGTPFVPTGDSVWELGVSRDPRKKADDDYNKRLKDSGGLDPATTSYVSVTLRRWEGKDSWAAARRAEGYWHDVRALDADNIESWLGTAPAVHLWLSGRLGAFPEGAIDFETACNQWIFATEPPLPRDFMLAGRQEAAKRLRAWLEQPTQALAVRAESREEVLGVVGAVIDQLPGAHATRARAVVVYDANAWRRLTAGPQPLILLPLFEAGELVASATRAGHAVIVPLGESDVSDDALELPRISRREAADALTAALGDRIERRMADDYAALGRRSMMALRRRIALSVNVQQPSWASPVNGRSVLTVLLAGSWNDGLSGDRQVISTLSRAPYEEARDRFLRWTLEADPPLRRRNNAFYLVSRADAWALLARFLTRDDLERFEAVAESVLGTLDPQYDLPVDKRWMSGILAEPRTHSPLLRRGIAETLAIMGARGETGEPGWTPRDVSERVVRRLFESANTDWKRWASLHDVLPDLAEAAPDAFLDAVETGVNSASPVLRDVFTDRDDHPFGSSPHIGLVWAFERLAWSPQHLGRVSLVFARLAEIDPGGRYSNRPNESLAAIYRPWMPQTSAPLEQRFRVIDMLRERAPQVAWPLLASMLPQFHGIGMYGSRPKWRDWAPDSESGVPRTEYARAVREVVARMLRDVGTDGMRWRVLIEALPMLSTDDHELVLSRLAIMKPAELTSSNRETIWDTLRKLVANHRSFQDAEWAMAPEAVDRLDALISRFEPEDPVAKYGYLFGYHPELLEGRPADEGEGAWKAYHAYVADKRRSAIGSVYASSGLEGLLAIARVAEEASVVGALAADIDALAPDELDILGDHFASSDRRLAAFAYGFAARRVEVMGPTWVAATLARVAEAGNPWSLKQRAYLFHVLPATPDTWRVVVEHGPDVEGAYWQGLSPYAVDIAHTDTAIHHLLSVGRPNTALDLLARRMISLRGKPVSDQVPNPALAIDVLSRALSDDSEQAKIYDYPSGSIAYHLSQVLHALSRCRGVDEEQLARLEWRYLPIVGRYDRRPRLLESLLARDPAFFVEVVKYVYRGEGDDPREVTDDDRQRASRGFSLLNDWRMMPGTIEPSPTVDENGSGAEPAGRPSVGPVDAAALELWVRAARTALADSGRSAIGDQLIGRVLSASPFDADGTWPSRAVRDLIEELASTELERGFLIGVYNSRGVTTRNPTDGGTLERNLAERYDGLAAVVADQWPRTGKMLRMIADGYRRDATREDHDAALGEDLDL
jgi:hypothetical protein